MRNLTKTNSIVFDIQPKDIQAHHMWLEIISNRQNALLGLPPEDKQLNDNKNCENFKNDMHFKNYVATFNK